ncbi:MAG: LysR family transcriptional regulator [Candidatus Nanopelagicales bacterium]
MQRLNINQLATLREFARWGTMAEAADVLGYTPGAVSQQLAELEKAVGVTLFIKVGRRSLLTDAGHALAVEAERVLAAEDRARSSVMQAGGEIAGTLVLGTWGSSAAALLAPLLAESAKRFPELTVTTREVDADFSVRSVSRGEVDLAFGLEHPEAPLPRERSTSIVNLLTERYWVAGAVQQQLPPGRPPSLADLADEAWILPAESTVLGRVARAAFRRVGVEPRVQHEVNDVAATVQMAAQGLGITLATDMWLPFVQGEQLPRTAIREEIIRDIVMVAPAEVSWLSATQALIQLAARVVPDAVARR